MEPSPTQGYRGVDVVTAVEAAPGAVGLAFDDGYLDIAENALPELERHGFTATVFLATGVTDGRAPLSWYSAQPPLLSWDDVRRLDGGAFRFEAHTVTHPNLLAVGEARAREEIAGSKHELEERLGRTVTAFCYPAGLYGPREVRLAAEAGFRVACTCEPGLNTPDDEPAAPAPDPGRRRDSLLDFRAKLGGGFDGRRGCGRGGGAPVTAQNRVVEREVLLAEARDVVAGLGAPPAGVAHPAPPLRVGEQLRERGCERRAGPGRAERGGRSRRRRRSRGSRRPRSRRPAARRPSPRAPRSACPRRASRARTGRLRQQCRHVVALAEQLDARDPLEEPPCGPSPTMSARNEPVRTAAGARPPAPRSSSAYEPADRDDRRRAAVRRGAQRRADVDRVRDHDAAAVQPRCLRAVALGDADRPGERGKRPLERAVGAGLGARRAGRTTSRGR